jgi:hypothetical protein
MTDEPILSRQYERPESSGRGRVDLVGRAVRTWTGELVDLGGRNTLLYYRDLKQGTLDIGPGSGANAVAQQAQRHASADPVRRGTSVAAGGHYLHGIADLVIALSIGFLADLGPVQVFHGTASPLPLNRLPLALIPTVAVPIALTLHVIPDAASPPRARVRSAAGHDAGGRPRQQAEQGGSAGGCAERRGGQVASSIDLSLARSLLLALRIAPAMNGARMRENPAGSPRLRRVMWVAPLPASDQV